MHLFLCRLLKNYTLYLDKIKILIGLPLREKKQLSNSKACGSKFYTIMIEIG